LKKPTWSDIVTKESRNKWISLGMLIKIVDAEAVVVNGSLHPVVCVQGAVVQEENFCRMMKKLKVSWT
jgi:hypothetical protein